MSDMFSTRLHKGLSILMVLVLCLSLGSCSQSNTLNIRVPNSIKSHQPVSNGALHVSCQSLIQDYQRLLNANFKKGFEYQDKHQNGNAVFRLNQYSMSAVITFLSQDGKVTDFNQVPSGAQLTMMYPAYDSSMLNHARILASSFWLCFYPSMKTKDIRLPKLYTNPDDFHKSTYASLYDYQDIGFYNRTYAMGNSIVWAITAAKDNLARVAPIQTQN